jgi:hypothetical protein
MLKKISRPQEGEYAAYALAYISLVPDDNVLLHLMDNCKVIKELIGSLPEEKLLYRYAEGKWTIKEILNHLIDCERIYCYRALCISRLDATPLPGFEQDAYVRESNANERDTKIMLDDYGILRHSTLVLFNTMTDDMLPRKGTANNNPLSVRAAAYQIAGHELHHLKIIRERYL